MQVIEQESCQVCEKKDELMRCSQCKSVFYCSVECQKKDWKQHKHTCSEIQLKQQREKQKAERKALGKRAIEDFADFEIIGHGNFSDIYKVRELETNQLYALKQINKRKLQQVNKEKDIYMEKHCLGKLVDNPYVIRLYSTFQDDENLYMLLEYIDGGELWQQIHHFGARSLNLCKYYLSEIVKALNQIHSAGIVHRDIKSENILLTKDKRIKFIDFGTARDMNDSTIEGSGNGRKGKQTFKHFVGTPQFMAPECIRNKDSNEKSDIYSLGVLFYHVVFGKYPFDGKSDYLVFQQALETELTFPEGWIANEQLKNLIKKMLQKQATDRPSLDEIMQDEFWQPEVDWNQQQDYQQVFNNLNDIDKFTYELGSDIINAEKLEDKICVKFEVNKILNKYKENIKEPDYQNRLNYVQKIAENMIANLQEDDGE